MTGVPQRDIVAAARTLGRASNAIILTARGAEQQAQGVANVLSFINLALAMGRVGRPFNGYGCLTGQGNGQGGREHGQKADQLPGYRQLDDASAREHIASLWGIAPEDLPGPGRSAYELLDTLGRERGVRGLLVMGSNPVVSAPHATHIEERLGALDFLVVCDFFLSETARLADVVLPSAQWAEEEGTMTNLEGRVIRRRRVVDPPPAACVPICGSSATSRGRSDAATGFSASAGAVFNELRQATAGAPADYSGITPARIDRQQGVFWPCPSTASPGTPRLFADRFHTLVGPGALSSRAVVRSGRTAGCRVPVLSDDRPRAGALPVGHADAPRQPAAPRGARGRGGDASARGTALGPGRRRRSDDRDAARPRFVPPEDDAGHSRGHDLRAVPLAGRAVGEPPDQSRARSDQQDAGIQGVCGAGCRDRNGGLSK